MASPPASPGPRVEVDTLGEVAVRSVGGVVGGAKLGGRRARVLVVALAIAEGPVTSDTLARLLWSGDPPPTWSAALRGVVRGVRTAVGAVAPDLVVTLPGGYRLDPSVQVDLIAAVESVAEAERLLVQARYAAVVGACAVASRHRGDSLLPGEEDEHWDRARRRVDATALRALQLSARARSALGDHHSATALARTAVERAPLDESCHRVLITVLDAAGDRAGVVHSFEACRAALADELGVDPSAETVELYLTALRDQPASGPARIPTFGSTFLGRTVEFDRVTDVINVPGVVSLVGPGGVGKSRLAAEVASVRGDFVAGRWWVPLSSVAEPALVAATVAMTLGVPPGTEDAGEAVAAHLARLGRGLVVLDGCEAAPDGATALAQQLVDGCPQLTVVVTSRLPMGLEGERIVPVEPWPVARPGTVPAVEPVAVTLLRDRVRAGGGELDLEAPGASELADQLSRRCAGLPLALELAAAQLTAMSLGDLVDALDSSGEWADPLRDMASSSLALLDDDEAAVFRRLAVVEGPASLRTIQQVVAGGGLPPQRVIRILRELAARGLLTVDRSGPRWRYQQDDDLHRLAGELLVASGEEGSALRRLVGAIEALLPEDPRSSPTAYIATVNSLLGSLRGVLAAALDGRIDGDVALALVFRLHRYWAATNVGEGRFWMARLLAQAGPSRAAMLTTYALGYLSYWAGDVEEAVRRLETAVAGLRGAEDAYVARALIYLAGMADDQDRGADAVQHVVEAVAAAEGHGSDLQVAASIGMGCVLAERADPAAVVAARDAIDLCRSKASVEQLTAALPTAAMICWQVGDLDAAQSFIDEAWPLHQDGARIAHVVLLSAAAGVALARGDHSAATEFATRGDVEATDLGVEREVPLVRCLRSRSRLAAGDVDGALIHGVAAVRAAGDLAYDFPLALGLEAVVLAALARPEADRVVLARLLATAHRIRARGDRPGPPSLQVDLEREARGLPSVAAVDVPLPREARVAAIDLVAALTRRH